MTWKQAYPESIVIRDKDALGPPRGIQRVYAKEGKEYPRIKISILDTNSFCEPKQFSVHAAYRESATFGWQESQIPIELMDELIDMLQEQKKWHEDIGDLTEE